MADVENAALLGKGLVRKPAVCGPCLLVAVATVGALAGAIAVSSWRVAPVAASVGVASAAVVWTSFGCSNWGDILVSRFNVDSRELCEEACRRVPEVCRAFNYNFCGESPDNCFLFSGNCHGERSGCWEYHALKPEGLPDGVLGPKTASPDPPPGGPRCMITSAGADGIGHQTEAKLTCIGAAAALGLEYVHVPMCAAEHIDNPVDYEDFFGIGTLFRTVNLEMDMMPGQQAWDNRLNNDPICGDSSLSWCEADGVTVYSADNCFRLFFCSSAMATWPIVAPSIRQAYYATPKPDPNWLDGLPQQSWGAKVVLHIRRGDSDFQTDAGFFVRAISRLREDLIPLQPPPLFRVETDAHRDELLQEAPELMADDVVIDDIDTPLELAIHRMVTANILVVCASSLSMMAALIGTQNTVLAPCEVTKIRTATILNWEIESCP